MLRFLCSLLFQTVPIKEIRSQQIELFARPQVQDAIVVAVLAVQFHEEPVPSAVPLQHVTIVVVVNRDACFELDAAACTNVVHACQMRITRRPFAEDRLQGTAAGIVIGGAADQYVVAKRPQQVIATGSADQEISARSTDEPVGAALL